MTDGQDELMQQLAKKISVLRAKAIAGLDETDPATQRIIDRINRLRLSTEGTGPKAPPREAFLTRANFFLLAHLIALGVTSIDAEQSRIEAEQAYKDVERIDMGLVRTVAELKHLENDFFIFWNEGPPEITNRFWREATDAGLPYVKRDMLSEILNHGRISSVAQYEFAKDQVVVAAQLGLITSDDVRRIGGMIDSYERHIR